MYHAVDRPRRSKGFGMVRLEDRPGDARAIEAAQAPLWERRYTRRSARARTFAPTRASVEAVAGEQPDPDERLVPVADGRDRPAVLDRAFRMSRTSRRLADIVSSVRARTCDLGGFTEIWREGHGVPRDEGRPTSRPPRVEASCELTRTRQDRGEHRRVRRVLPADYEVVVDASGSTGNSGPSANVRLTPAGLFSALRPIDYLSVPTFDATSSDAYVLARLQ
jgi:hypothetical protein